MLRLLTAIVLLTSSLARAEAVAVTPLDGLGVEPKLLARLNAALARELRAVPDLTVVDAAAEPPCDGEPACLKQLGERLSAARVLAGSVARAGDEIHIALKLVTLASAEAEPRTVNDTAPVERAELRVRGSAIKLVRPDQFNKSASILLVLPLEGAEVFVDGAARGTTPMFGPIDGLPPGRRDVEVRHADATVAPWRGFVDLRFAEPHRLELALVDGALREVVESPPPGEITPPPTWSPGAVFWSGVGVAAVGAAIGVGAIVAYDATLTAGTRLTLNPTQDNQRAYREIAAVCGTLTAGSVVALVAGGGLIAFGVVE